MTFYKFLLVLPTLHAWFPVWGIVKAYNAPHGALIFCISDFQSSDQRLVGHQQTTLASQASQMG